MAITVTMTRLIGTLVSMLQTRLELITIELEEELLRVSSCFFLALCTLFFAGITVLLGLFLVIVLFWDAHRIGILITMMSLFGVLSVACGFWLKHRFFSKPFLLEQSMAELKKDVALFSTSQKTDHAHRHQGEL
jgi:uncharacterized membrane protein YqjE